MTFSKSNLSNLLAKPFIRYFLIGAVLWAAFIFFGRFSLAQPFFEDDLHLIRQYTPRELMSTWQATWDPDQIETPGFRPLTTLFNHLRASAFGEAVVMHRLFLLGLFALLAVLLIVLARQLFAIPERLGVLAGLLAFLHISSTYHYLWVSDGVHLLVGLLIVAMLLCLLRALATNRAIWLLPALLSLSLALLTREDALIAYPLAILFVSIYLIRYSLSVRSRAVSLIGFSLISIVLLATYWWWRSRVVSNGTALTIDLDKFLWALLQIPQNLGDPTNLIVWWREYIALMQIWLVCLGVLVAAYVFLLPRAARLQALLWALAAIVSALPTATLSRLNLLLMPAVFWGLCVATILVEFAKHSAAARWCAIAIACLVLAGSAWGSATFQAERNPASIDWICGQSLWAYGDTSNATIPAVRREFLEAQLHRFGVDSLGDLYAYLLDMLQAAHDAKRYGPIDQSGPFIPYFPFLAYPGWYTGNCAAQSDGLFRLPNN
jgi:hypothetical protein